jgi:NADH-quinone oxidoreductase subunit N
VFLTAFPGLYDAWDAIPIWLAVITMLAANLVALVQGNVKRMLAYSSVAHAGYLLVALAAASVVGAASFLFYALAYTLMTMGAFAVVVAVAGRHEANLDLEAYAGLGWRHPLLGAAMTVFLLSLAGFPFTAGFIGKVFIARAAIERGLIPLAVILVLASLISYYYYLRVAWYMWFREAPAEAGAGSGVALSPGLAAGLAAAAILIIVLGVFPGVLLAAAERSAADLLRLPVTALGLRP